MKISYFIFEIAFVIFIIGISLATFNDILKNTYNYKNLEKQTAILVNKILTPIIELLLGIFYILIGIGMLIII